MGDLMIGMTALQVRLSGGDQTLRVALQNWASAGDSMVAAWNNDGLSTIERQACNDAFHKAESELYLLVKSLLPS